MLIRPFVKLVSVLLAAATAQAPAGIIMASTAPVAAQETTTLSALDCAVISIDELTVAVNAVVSSLRSQGFSDAAIVQEVGRQLTLAIGTCSTAQRTAVFNNVVAILTKSGLKILVADIRRNLKLGFGDFETSGIQVATGTIVPGGNVY